MTPEQALELITKATAHLKGDRNDHLQVIAALEILKKALIPQPQAPLPGQ